MRTEAYQRDGVQAQTAAAQNAATSAAFLNAATAIQANQPQPPAPAPMPNIIPPTTRYGYVGGAWICRQM